jgi:hypothetical protein
MIDHFLNIKSSYFDLFLEIVSLKHFCFHYNMSSILILRFEVCYRFRKGGNGDMRKTASSSYEKLNGFS